MHQPVLRKTLSHQPVLRKTLSSPPAAPPGRHLRPNPSPHAKSGATRARPTGGTQHTPTPVPLRALARRGSLRPRSDPPAAPGMARKERVLASASPPGRAPGLGLAFPPPPARPPSFARARLPGRPGPPRVDRSRPAHVLAHPRGPKYRKPVPVAARARTGARGPARPARPPRLARCGAAPASLAGPVRRTFPGWRPYSRPPAALRAAATAEWPQRVALDRGVPP